MHVKCVISILRALEIGLKNPWKKNGPESSLIEDLIIFYLIVFQVKLVLRRHWLLYKPNKSSW